MSIPGLIEDHSNEVREPLTPQPGSQEEMDALARIDIARMEDVRTYEGKRAHGWDARAGRPLPRFNPDLSHS